MRKVYYFDEIDSTNEEAKRLLRERRGENLYGAVVSANRQTAGRGRLGRTFFSPGGDSVYVSFILKSQADPTEQRVTVFASVAVCLAIEKTTGFRPGIKWVNDVLMDGKKICGILAESIPNAVILGIGVNINLSKEDFPGDLRESAGSLCMDRDARARFFDVLNEEVFLCMAAAGADETNEGDSSAGYEAATLMSEYRKRSILTGKTVILIRGEDSLRVRALCEDVADDGALIVRYDDGSTEELRTSEISVRLTE